jgi:PTH1 family peptidyl-tRNA hydrolase
MVMKLIIGLGNPGKKYHNTRHNVGFRVVEELAHRHKVERQESKYDAIIAHIRIGSEKILIVKPLTYMNLSGRAVQPLLAYYKLGMEDLLVIYDDMDLPVGNLRVRSEGGAGGHKGVTSIIERLGGRGFARLRLGIGRPEDETIDWVLGKFSAREQAVMDQTISRAADAAEYWVQHGIDRTMNEYNSRSEA